MLISEVIQSLQGEGELAGVPSVVVRTCGCNLRCRWCDVPHASWEPQGKAVGIDALVATIARYKTTRHVVLTGGEPMIAQGIGELASALRTGGYHVTIETAATVPPAGIACDLVSLSPKLLNSSPDGAQHGPWRKKHEALRWQPGVIRAWIDGGYAYQFLWVICQPQDVDEVEGMMRSLGREVPSHKVLLMPEGTSPGVHAARSAWLAPLCRERGYRFAPRLPIDLLGNRRGT